MRNRDRKIVLRLTVIASTPEKPASSITVSRLQIHSLRGYEKQARTAAVRAATLGLNPAPRHLLDELLEIVTLTPRSYSSRFQIRLDPDGASRDAFVAISRQLLHTMKRNEAGLRADIDTEFLHDFRVSVRRQRSAMSHFHGTYDAEAMAPFAEGFVTLGRLTGPLRDLDVYLLDRDRYLAMVCPVLQPGLAARFDRLAARRNTELSRLRRTLVSPEYRELLERWAQLLDDLPPGPTADQPLLELARHRLRNRHRRVLRAGRAVTDATPDEDLHHLRIQCKKLRYLLEFTDSVFPSGAVGHLVSHLKSLQDNLGEFNDLSVQQSDIIAALDEFTGRGKAQVQEAAALGGLLAALVARHQVVRNEFADAFHAFDRRRVIARFSALYDPSKGRSS